MGRTLVRQVSQTPGCEISGATEPAGSEFLGRDAGALAGIDALGVTITDDPLELIAGANAVLDFTSPAAAVGHAALCAQARIVHVIGTTGFEPEQESAIAAAARHSTIVKAGNMSLGVNLLAQLTRQAAKLLDAAFDIEILEMHHRHKVDAPSGTALRLGEIISSVLKQELSSTSVHGRHGDTGARPAKQIGFHAIRGGDIVGEHTVIFAGAGERVELTIRSQSRMTYALGALRAARFLRGRRAGLYDMNDVLGLT